MAEILQVARPTAKKSPFVPRQSMRPLRMETRNDGNSSIRLLQSSDGDAGALERLEGKAWPVAFALLVAVFASRADGRAMSEEETPVVGVVAGKPVEPLPGRPGTLQSCPFHCE